tara:strand:+ start:20639 stop:20818 length:180 start_codon:yes stop_codon:yes gene_type:complete
MYISYFEFKKVLNDLEKEYADLQKSPRVQTDKKFGFYANLTLKRVDKEVRNYIQSKSGK